LDHRVFLDRFFRLAGVNFLSNLMVPLAGLLDVAFLGHLAEIRHLPGVALGKVLLLSTVTNEANIGPGGASCCLGLTIAIAFILIPAPLCGLLTDHAEIIDRKRSEIRARKKL
jgi:Na+-driven multidrug efflux pump